MVGLVEEMKFQLFVCFRTKKLLFWAFAILLVCIGVSGSMAIDRNHLLEIINDPDIENAVTKSAASLNYFVEQFNEKTNEKSDFMIVTCERHKETNVPVGILVETISGDTFTGRTIANDLTGTLGERISCQATDIIDWRFTETFVVCGGNLYKTLLNRLPPAMRHDVICNAGFFVERPSDFEFIDYEIAKQILRRDTAKLRDLLVANEIDAFKMRLLPMKRERTVVVVEASFLEFACMYGSKEVYLEMAQDSDLEKDAKGNLLRCAAMCGNADMLDFLSSDPAILHLADDQGRTALHFACSSGSLSSVKILMEDLASLNTKDFDGCTPIFHASTSEILSYLIEQGADLSLRSDGGETVVDYFRNRGNVDFCAILGAATNTTITDVVQVEEIGSKLIEGAVESGLISDDRGIVDALSRDFGFVLPIRAFVH